MRVVSVIDMQETAPRDGPAPLWQREAPHPSQEGTVGKKKCPVPSGGGKTEWETVAAFLRDARQTKKRKEYAKQRKN